MTGAASQPLEPLRHFIADYGASRRRSAQASKGFADRAGASCRGRRANHFPRRKTLAGRLLAAPRRHTHERS